MAQTGGPPYSGQDWEDDLEQHPATSRAIQTGIMRCNRWLRSHAHERFLDETLITALHDMAFRDVFPDFAGRLRGPSPNYIAYNVTFGSRRGVPHEDVPDAMQALGRDTTNLIKQLNDLKATGSAEDFLSEVTKAAAYTHCRFIEIHPFVNGNGRTGRLCINYYLRRYGFSLIAIQRPDEPEYLDAIRSWIDYRSVDHFARFLQAHIRDQ